MSTKYIGTNGLTYLITKIKAALTGKVDKSDGKGLSTNDYTTAEKTKLSGIATGATANATDAVLKARANHTGTQSADTITDGTTNKAFTAAEKTKLAGIATGANTYTHPAYTAKTAGLYKVTVDATGHSSANLFSLFEAHPAYYFDGSKLVEIHIGRAMSDSAGQPICSTYLKGLSVSGKVITYTKGDGTTGTITTQDTNTTYGAATTSAAGLMSATDKTKLDGLPTGGAYQLAVSGGYTGTQAQFNSDLAAIQGLSSLDTLLSGI